MKPLAVIRAGLLILSAITLLTACTPVSSATPSAPVPSATSSPTERPPASGTASAPPADPSPTGRPPATSTATALPVPSGAIAIEVGSDPRAVDTADFNLDGYLDAAVANSGDGTVTVLLGALQGPLLDPGQPIRAGHDPSDIEAVDVDQDGDPDIVVANHETSQITVLSNDGLGTFAEAPYSPVNTGALPHVHGVVSGDFNADGWPDVAVESADTSEVRILHGSQDGFLPPLAVHLPTMPYFQLGVTKGSDGGGPQILVPGHRNNTVLVVKHAGEEYSAETLLELDGQPWAVTSDDVSGDGRADIIVVETDALSIWLASGAGFTPASGSPFAIPGAQGVATGDLNGDLVSDIAVGPWEGSDVVLVNGGDFSMQSLTACERPIGLAVADFSGDRHPDLLVTCSTEDRVILLTFPRAN